METAISTFAIAVFSYAIGAAVAGYYLTYWRTGRDVRQTGSGTAGARNAARLLGTRHGALVFGWDFAKGAIVALAAIAVHANEPQIGMAATAVVVGHVWPAQLKFNGGKGVAPAAGAFIVWQPSILAVVAVAYLLARLANQNVEKSALLAFGAGILLSPVLVSSARAAVFCVLILAILSWTHRFGLFQSDRRSGQGDAR
ncbi:MAG TPA: glycerol-3-phosphate acyltransferase [Burkholderiales bacterium]|nr:glycerol-3-phosphate acyltransferase [Burkholderiales bacterium]